MKIFELEPFSATACDSQSALCNAVMSSSYLTNPILLTLAHELGHYINWQARRLEPI